MKSIKRIASKSIYDIALCFALLMPELFPNLSCADGFRTTAYVLVSIACVIAVLGVLAFSTTHSSGKRLFPDKEFQEIDLLYRIYEPASDLALTICLVIAGYCWVAGAYLFLGITLRTFTYNEFEEYKEEQENGSENN